MTRIGAPLIRSRWPRAGQLGQQWIARAIDYLELAKPRIVILELVTIAVAAHVAAPRGALSPSILLMTIVGAGLVAASAGAMNQWLERTSDAKMSRTSSRPLPGQRLTPIEVMLFVGVTLLAGTLLLALGVRPLTAVCGMAIWLIYIAAYTPLKSRSPTNTAVGAVAGALPILLGWTATGAPLDARAWAMTGVLFLWQFPHFMAIAWLYREDYARAGHQMLTVVDPTGLRAAAQGVVAALALIPVSLVIAILPGSGSPGVYCFWALVLGVGQLAAALRFLQCRDDTSARRLFRASLVYLPCWMGLLLMVSL